MSNAGDIDPVVGTPGQQAVAITTSQAEAAAALATAETAKAAADLNIDQASYDKYVKDGVMDWASYGKEQAFKAAQAAPTQPVTNPATQPDTAAAEAAAEAAAAAAAAEAAATAANAEEVTAKAGLDWNAVTEQVLKNGELDAESLKKLTDIGVPEVVVQDYIRAIGKEANEHIETVMNGFGGEENFNKVFEAVQAATTEEQRDRIDDLLRDPDTFAAGVTLATKYAGMEPVAPTVGKPVAGAVNQPAAAVSVEAFGSYKEQIAAQSDPRYKNDPSFRDAVVKRIAASSFDMNPRAHTGGM